MYCKKCGKKISSDDKYCGSCGEPVNQDTSKDSQLAKATSEGLGMKWFKFLIYFALILSVIVFLFEGLLLLTGSYYDYIYGALYGNNYEWKEMIYNTYPLLNIADKIYSLFLIAAAIFFVIIRTRLASFKKDAPSQYITFLLILVVVNTIYSITTSFILESADISLLANVFSLVGRYLLEKAYFTKRNQLFIN